MRISRERMYMDIAEALSRRSTCYRNNVGAVIVQVNDWRINGTGYNGAISGAPHCLGDHCPTTPDGGCATAIHAEMNALERMETPINGPQWMFCTRSPCHSCKTAIRDSGAIDRFYFGELYRDRGPIDVLMDAGIDVFRVTPGGYIISTRTGKVVNTEF